MSYYRASLAAAYLGNLTTARRLVCCSLALGEDAPSALHLFHLLSGDVNGSAETSSATESRTKAEVFSRLRILVEGRKYRKALRVGLPDTSASHTIRGLLYALRGRRRAAQDAFALALSMDAGNDTARRALVSLRKKRRFI